MTECYSYGLRHKSDTNKWTMGPLFFHKATAELAAHEVKARGSSDYDRVIIFRCNRIVEWGIAEPAKPATKPHKAHRRPPKHK